MLRPLAYQGLPCLPLSGATIYGWDMSTEDSTTPSEEMKRKFKEALQKKNADARAGEAHLDGTSAVQDSHGPAQHKREFRRKSG